MKKIFNAEAIESLTELIQDGVRVDAIITDPPYQTITGGSGKTKHKFSTNCVLFENDNFSWKPEQGWKQFKRDWLKKSYEIMKDQGHIYVMVNLLELEDMMAAMREVGFKIHNLLIWDKQRQIINRWYLKQVEYIIFARKGNAKSINNKGTSNLITMQHKKTDIEKKHPTPKPVELLEIFINNSTNEGDLVLDPFMGLGSTCIAATRNNRNFVGIEINKEYYELMKRRLYNEE